MDRILCEELSLAESMLSEAKESLRDARYENAEACARTALGGFLLVRDEAEVLQKFLKGVHEASGIILEARQRWAESGGTSSMEAMDKLREMVRAETEEFFQDSRAAVQAAINGVPLARRP